MTDAGSHFAAGGSVGSGGIVVLGSREATLFAGSVDVCGGAGLGGSVEVSSAGRLDYVGTTQASGTHGAGSLLLDPRDLTLDDTTGVLAQYPLADPNPNGNGFARFIRVLSGGNIVVADPSDDFSANQLRSGLSLFGYDGRLDLCLDRIDCR